MDVAFIHEYPSCTGTNCGKRVFSEKTACVKCGKTLSDGDNFEDYRATLVVITEEGELSKLTVFRKKVMHLEEGEGSAAKKLEHLKEKRVKIIAQKSYKHHDDDAILSELTLL